MAKIVCIHGIGQDFEGPETLKNRWLDALNDGLNIAGSQKVSSEDVQLVFFGNLFRPDVDYRNVSGGAELQTPDELSDDGWKEDLLVEWWKEAAQLSQNENAEKLLGTSEVQPPNMDGRARTPKILQSALLQLSKTKFFKLIGPKKLLISTLGQVKLFLHDAEYKRKIIDRVRENVSGDTQIVIGHSLGSIVAYEALCLNPSWQIKGFVTLGSPLGIRNLIFDNLTPKPDGKIGFWPGNVKRWTNICDSGDIVALEKKLSVYFRGVEDHMIYNGWQSHDIRRYLSSEVTGKAIANCLYHM
ncbi:MAG: hypothetical protein ACOYXT_17350 [Bacteroidota bacterium]